MEEVDMSNSRPGPKPTEWPKEKVAMLKKLYPKHDNEEVAKQMGVSVSALRNAAQRFKVKKSDRYWDKPDHDFLLKNWPVMSAEEIGKELKKTRWAVINKYRELTGKR